MIKNLSLPFLAGSWLLFVSSMVLIGWWLDNPALVSAIPGHINMVFNAALCFVLGGVALVLPDRLLAWQVYLRRTIGCVILLIAGLTLTQMLFHYSLGIDQLFSEATIDVFNPVPGRMGHSTAVLFLMLGLVFATWSAKPSKVSAIFMMTTIAAMLLAGLSSLTGYWLGLDFLYHNSFMMRMSAYSSVNFTVLGLGLWVIARKHLALISFYNDRHDKKILVTSAAILFLVALVGELTGFSVFTSQNETLLKNNLRGSLNSGVKTFSTTLNRAIQEVDDLATDARFTALLARHPATLLNELNLLFTARRYSAVQITNAGGGLLFSSGHLTHPADAMTPLRLSVPDRAELFWGKGWTLRLMKSLTDHGQKIGTLLVEIPMLSLDRFFGNSLGLGETGKILVCAPSQAGTILCAVSRHESAPAMLVVNATSHSPSARLALSGKSGEGMEVDTDNNEAFTMFAPIKTLGLAVIAKRDMSELYAAIRVQFEVVLPILLFSVGLGMLLLSWQVAPLVRKIVVSEKKALSTNARLRESESRFRSAFEYSAVGMALVSLEGRWLRSNYSLGKILGYSEAEFLGMDYQRITNADDIPKMKQKLADLVAGKSQGVSMTKRFITRNREMIWVMVNASLVYDMAHKPLYYIFQIQDIDQQKHAEERLTLMAYHDALTGLDNRAAIERDVEAALLTAGSKQQNFALLFLDLDHFKEVNDLYGHDVGDALLKEVAQRLQRSVRRTDKVGRLGGDEFVILLENIADEEVVVEIAKKILRTIAVPMVINDVTLSVTSSVGISRYPNNGVTMEALMKRADIALYCAKECGKDNFQFFESASINP